MTKKVYIRADGSTKIGLGHLTRCLALAQMIRHEFEIIFVVIEAPENLSQNILNKGFQINRVNSEAAFLLMLRGDELVVLDHYGLGKEIQKKIKMVGSKLICIDDLGGEGFYADLIINHSPGIDPRDYKAQFYTKYALGPAYALLRPAFIRAADEMIRKSRIENLLVCFGGSDYSNLTQQVLKVLKEDPRWKRITVILGAAFKHTDIIDELVGESRRIRVLSSLDENEMVNEIKNSDLAIIPASGILLEVIAGGCIPYICYYAENQKKLFNYFRKKTAIPSFDGINFNQKKFAEVMDDVYRGEVELHTLSHIVNDIKKSPSNHLRNFRQLASCSQQYVEE